MTGLDKELERLYQQTGDGGVLPDRAGKYVTVSGARKDLSADQFVQYATKKGTTAFDTAEAVTKTALYGKLTDSQKAQAIKDAYAYADAVAKKGLGLGYEPDKWVNRAQNMDAKTRAALLAARVLLADGEDAWEKRDILRGAKLPEEQKIQVYRTLISDSKDEEIQKLKAAGLSFDDFLLAQNKRGEIDDMDASASGKATEFAHWASQEGYSEEQVTALREVFQFYSFVPSDEIKYDKFVEAGFDEEQSYTLSGALADVGGIHGDKDANGNSVYLSSSRKKKAAIDKATPGLSQQERRAIYEMFGVSKKVW